MKPRAEIFDPDGRYAHFLAPGEHGELRPMTFDDHYDMAAGLELPLAISAGVRRSWARALHALVYSWFDYELMMVAEGQAFASTELAFKEKLGFPEGEGPRGLGGRLKVAIERGLIAPSISGNGWKTTHEILVLMRNEIVHGTDHVHDPNMAQVVFDHLRALICELHGVEPRSLQPPR